MISVFFTDESRQLLFAGGFCCSFLCFKTLQMCSIRIIVRGHIGHCFIFFINTFGIFFSVWDQCHVRKFFSFQAALDWVSSFHSVFGENKLVFTESSRNDISPIRCWLFHRRAGSRHMNLYLGFIWSMNELPTFIRPHLLFLYLKSWNCRFVQIFWVKIFSFVSRSKSLTSCFMRRPSLSEVISDWNAIFHR